MREEKDDSKKRFYVEGVNGGEGGADRQESAGSRSNTLAFLLPASFSRFSP